MYRCCFTISKFKYCVFEAMQEPMLFRFGKAIGGAGDGNRTHVFSLGS